ncbi:heavy metal translocating P-type ATPase [Dokdonella sp.]|uniref:heavy metal translocating P-type ATPase n=2 Tax=Dokdonella sp. TaxID=2291710 RepID=UPI002CC9C5E6|nr:heavy metal translocating P-type ATPase [Dokdonella sp.]HOX70577.1 heavy metal translocating P-type ATPase [Dokdonella sp.]HPN80237.1 heavy metal translocating P-type ATPase [Dokdonella sp.]
MSAAGCWHCGETLPAVGAVLARSAGIEHAVCCQGCRAAVEWIDQLGLADYYRLRSEPATRVASGVDIDRDSTLWSRPELARHVVRELEGGQRETLLLIDGVRCAACVWLIERSLGSLAGMTSVQVNASARRARIVWDDSRCTLARIIETLARTGYQALPLDAATLDDLRRRESRAALKRLLVAGFGAMQAMMIASGLYLGAFDGTDTSMRDLLRWFSLLVATPVVLYAARPFFAGAWRSVRAGALGMDVPVALAVALIYLSSLIETVQGGREVYFDSVSMFVFILLIGRYLEMRARHRSGDLSDALARLSPPFADRMGDDGSLQRVGAIELQVGDRIHVAEGSGVPADGTLLSARCRVDESLLSGESRALTRQCGETLIAGSLLLEGPAELRVERVGGDTVLAGIGRLVTRAATQRPRLALAGERAAAHFVARVLSLAALTALGWTLFEPSRAFAATLAVLVVSCPCAFALAVPAALTRALAVLARRGVLVARADAIEQLAMASHAVFDKTGTLTEPHLALESQDPGFGTCDSRDARSRHTVAAAVANDALALAGSLARGSRHPLALAITTAAGNLATHAVEAMRAETGGGLEGIIDGRKLRLGHAGFALTAGVADTSLDDAVVLADDSGVIAAFHLTERLRPGAKAAVDALVADGLSIEICSGDAPTKVAAAAAQLGIKHWHARLRPADKLARLSALHADGARVIVVGDGINDAPILAAADVAVSFASGADLAQASSDIVLAGDRLDALGCARRIARETLRVLRQNQRWALAYNLLAVPFAALGFVPPWLAAIGMSASSLVVVLNALRIGREQPRYTAALRPAVGVGR